MTSSHSGNATWNHDSVTIKYGILTRGHNATLNLFNVESRIGVAIQGEIVTYLVCESWIFLSAKTAILNLTSSGKIHSKSYKICQKRKEGLVDKQFNVTLFYKL